MPLSYSVEPPALFLLRATGHVTHGEGASVIQAIGADERFGPGSRMLVDARSVIKAPQRSELKNLAGDLAGLFQRGMYAVAIVTDQGFVYGVARMFAMFAELLGIRVGVCLTLEDGFEWLAEQKPPTYARPELPPDDDSLEGA